MIGKLGPGLFFGGLFLLLYTGAHYLDQSESFSFFGIDFFASGGEITPVLLSAGIMILGIILSSGKR